MERITSWDEALCVTALLAAPLIFVMNTNTALNALLQVFGFRPGSGRKRSTKREIGAWVVLLLLLSTTVHLLTSSGVIHSLARSGALAADMQPAHDESPTIVVLLSCALAGVSFLLLGVVFDLWAPTRHAGAVIVGRVLDSHSHWQRHALRSFCELFVWLTITSCAYLRTNDVLAAVLAGIMATVLVVLGSDWVVRHIVSRLRVSVDEEPVSSGKLPKDSYLTRLRSISDALSCSDSDADSSESRGAGKQSWRVKGASYLLPGILVVANVVTSLTNLIYDHHQHVVTLFLLATVSGIVAVSLSEVLVIYPPTVACGRMLQQRIHPTSALRNWQHHTVRSLVEVGTWALVSYFTYTTHRSLILAAKYGTVAGMLLALAHHLVTTTFLPKVATAMEVEMRSQPGKDARRPLSRYHLPMLIICTLAGWTLLNMVHEHYHSIGALMAVATAAGVAMVLLVELLPLFFPAYALRIRLRIDSWVATARAVAELGAWGFATWSLYSLNHNLVAALQWGAIAGILIICSGEYVAASLDKLPVQPSAASPSPSSSSSSAGPSTPQAILPVAGIIFVVGFDAMKLALRDATPRVEGLAALITLAGVLFVAASEVLISFEPTRAAGTVLQSRITDTAKNWRSKPLRSFVEITSWLAVTFGTFQVTHSVVSALKLGTLCGCAFILFLETASGNLVPKALVPHRHGKAGLGRAGLVVEACCRYSRRPRVTLAKVGRAQGPITLQELAKHCTADDLWIAIHGNVYDVTQWLPAHPGGDVLLKFGGVDCSDQYEAFHLERVRPRLAAFYVGQLAAAAPASDVTVEYRALRERLQVAGYYKPRLSFYLGKVCLLAACLAGSAAAAAYLPCSWYRPIIAGSLMALLWQQSAYLAHDALHNGILPPPRNGAINPLGWLFCGVLFGISPGLWADEHNVHHAASLRVAEDPQFSYLPVWLTSLKELQVVAIDRVARFLVPIQHWTVIPACLLVGRLNLQRLSILHTLRTRRLQDATAMGVHIAMMVWWAALLQSRQQAAAALFTAYLTIGLLHVELLLSHLGKETVFKEDETRLGFCKTQVITARNLETHWYNDWFFGGLQYQIEHHLFPMLPRHRLREVVPMVRALCERHGVEYECLTPTEALKVCLKDMHRLSYALVNVELG